MLTLMISVVRYYLLFFIIFLFSCHDKLNPYFFYGSAQGSTYTIKYNTNKKNVISSSQIDSLFNNIEFSMSNYNYESIISSINRGEDVELDSLIEIVLNKSIEVCFETDGMFDVTVSPLVNKWGFGPIVERKNKFNSTNYELVVGCDKFIIQGDKIIKDANVTIDLNGIAQGFTVDYIANFFLSKGIDNFMIEVGGEVRCSGDNFNKKWKIAIDKPTNKTREILFVLSLNDLSLATSGSYRKFYYNEDSIKINHTMNPLALEPAFNNLISATILHKDCMLADAYATACMSFGLADSKLFLTKMDIPACLIYTENRDTMFYFSNNFSSFLHSKPGSAPQ